MIEEYLRSDLEWETPALQRLAKSQEVHVLSLKLPAVVLNFSSGDPGQILPVEIRYNADELGWVYTLPDDTWVILGGKGEVRLYRLLVFRKLVADWGTAWGKRYTDVPTGKEGHLLRREDGSVLFHVSRRMLFEEALEKNETEKQRIELPANSTAEQRRVPELKPGKTIPDWSKAD